MDEEMSEYAFGGPGGEIGLNLLACPARLKA